MAAAISSTEQAALLVRVARTDEIGVGQGRCFLIGSRKIALFRSRSGTVHALDAVCPHRAGPLAEGIIGHDIVVCPMHGYKFSLLDGRGLDNGFAVTSYPSQIRNGDIYISLDASAAHQGDTGK